MTGEIHAAASVFTKRKENSALVKSEAVWTAEPAWILWRKKNYLSLAGNQISTISFPYSQIRYLWSYPIISTLFIPYISTKLFIHNTNGSKSGI
jgi:hypothetical protein